MPMLVPYVMVKQHFVRKEGVSEHRYDMMVHETERTSEPYTEDELFVIADARQSAINGFFGAAQSGARSIPEFARCGPMLEENTNSYHQPDSRQLFQDVFRREWEDLAEVLKGGKL